MNENQKKNDTSNLQSIVDISKNFKTKAELQNELERVYDNLSKAKIEMAELLKLLGQKNLEIEHLKNLPQQAIPNINHTEMEFSVEEEIALKQLDMLRTVAMSRAFTPEEAKIYDILVKNKRLAQGNSTIVADYKKLPQNLSEKNLLQIAEAQIVGDKDERKS